MPINTYKPSKSPILKLWKSLGNNSIGQWLVSKIVCFKAPYFSSIKPQFIKIEPGCVEVRMKKRRSIQNHIQTIHAIAMCNAAELAGGTCLDVSLTAGMRWIPVGMQVKYLKMAKTDLKIICQLDKYDWNDPQDIVMPVGVFDIFGEEVFHANITMRISHKN